MASLRKLSKRFSNALAAFQADVKLGCKIMDRISSQSAALYERAERAYKDERLRQGLSAESPIAGFARRGNRKKRGH